MHLSSGISRFQFNYEISELLSGCVTICNDPVAGDGVWDPRLDHCRDQRELGILGTGYLGEDRTQVSDDHARFHDDRDDAGHNGADIVCGGADNRDDEKIGANVI